MAKINDKIIRKLIELADDEYRKFHSSLCPNTDNIIGVRIPRLREIAKEIAKQKPQEFLREIDDTYYETVMLYGMVIGYMKADLKEKQKYLDIFIPKIDNWAVCDCCASTYKFTNNHLKEMWEYIRKYINSDKEFEVRFAIVMMMNYYLNEQYIDSVLTILEEIKNNGYYVKMAVAWTISVAFVKHEKKTRELLAKETLDEFTYSKALQKIIESNRVGKKVKNEIKEMKKKL